MTLIKGPLHRDADPFSVKNDNAVSRGSTQAPHDFPVLLTVQVGQRMLQLDFITEKLSKQVMEHYEEMGQRLP